MKIIETVGLKRRFNNNRSDTFETSSERLKHIVFPNKKKNY